MPETFCFIVEFRNPETDQVFAEIGRAETKPTCRELIRHEVMCWRSRGYEFLNTEFCLEGDGESHGDFKSATRAIQLLEELKDKPFFLAAGCDEAALVRGGSARSRG